MIMINNFMEDYPGYTEEVWDNLNIETKGGLKDYIKYYENISEDNKEEINELQENKELISKNRSNDIRGFFKYHFYLLNLRKKDNSQALENSKTLISKSYDYNINDPKNLLNYDGKCIKKELMSYSDDEKKEINLKENEYNENELIKIKKFFSMQKEPEETNLEKDLKENDHPKAPKSEKDLSNFK